MKKFSLLLMAALLVSAVMVLGSCESKEATYKVTVADSLGTPYSSGIVVKFMQNGEQAAMQACDENGVAEKTLPRGDYDIELSFTDGEENYYYEEGGKLSSKETELTITLARKISSEPQVLYVGGGEFDAYPVDPGCTYVDLVQGQRNYFLFIPTQAGTYEFSIEGGANAEIGYYGAPHFVQSTSAAEIVDNKFTISIKQAMIGTGDGGTSIFVLGVDALDSDTNNCVIGINRIGDPQKTIEDEPWEVYEKTAELTEYSLPADAEIKEFDLTASSDAYNFVFNESDGFYHLDEADGPLVLVRLAEDCDYIACFATILEKQGSYKYFFDGNGTEYENFVKRENYTDCLNEYLGYVDENEGVYPLTEDLKYIIQQHGDHAGWWDIESPGYIFRDMDGNDLTDINIEIAWLLMCCYID